MALILNEEQTMLRDSALDFISENAPIAHLRKLRDTHDPTGFSRPLWARFGEMGFAGVRIPEAHGGLALGHIEAGIIAEALGRTLAPSPMLSSAVVATTLLLEAGSDAQQAKWLPEIAAGRAVVALAIDESAKHRPDRIAASCRRAGDGFVVDGDKRMVVDGHAADLLIVATRTENGEGITLIAIEPGAAGVTIERTVMVDAHNAARVNLRGVKLGADALLGAPGTGSAALERALDAGRAMLAAEMIGIADEVFARTVKYLAERKQFGVLIGEFQALQHRASHLYCEIEFSRAAVAHALARLDENPADAAEAVSIAKARAGATVTLAVQEGVQMHGGMGMTDQFDIGLFMKRARVTQELFGDEDFHTDRMSALRGY